MSSSVQTGRRRRFQQGSLLAIPGAVAIVVGSQLLEGGSWGSLLQSTAALIVLGGTLAATLISYAPGAVFEAVKQAALGSLRKMFGHNKVPEPEAFVFPRWLSDPWTMGGYSYPAIGSPPEDHYDHARPLGNRVFFAGEATEPVEYGTVHAALWSAEQTAEALFRAATGVEAARDRRPWAGARRGAGRHNG